MPQYFFLLGQTPHLSETEIEVVFSEKKPQLVNPSVVEMELENDQQAKESLQILGGVVKIARKIEEFPSKISPETLTEKVTDAFVSISSNTTQRKITFGISEIGRDHLPKIELAKIKQQLNSQNYPSRYIDSPRHGLSASVLLHQDQVNEIMIVQAKQAVFLGVTVAVQNIDQWSLRDRQKPYADKKKGMLPPKLARILLNIAINQYQKNRSNNKHSKQLSEISVYDPFCGSGTVLMESLLRGCQIVGSDQDTDAVLGSSRNLEWLVRNKQLMEKNQQGVSAVSTPHIFVKDATQVQLQDLNNRKVDLIVTEPFLGKPRPQPSFLPRMFKGLEKLYLGCFKNWVSLLEPKGVVAIIFPKVTTKKQTFTMHKLIDKLEKIGYINQLGPIEYGRPKAIVTREIYIFSFK